MDAFRVHERLIKDYAAFTEGFVEIRDERIRDRVAQQAAAGAQWPAPHLALNPAFHPGGRIDQLVADGLLHPEVERIFRLKSDDDPVGRPITLHQHQRDAVEIARTGASYVLTTGTGSGKSLAYIVPIVDAVLREPARRGVKAIVVYPMNALANSQREELAKFLTRGYPDGQEPVTFARYTGQEDEEERQRILADPPDILLTNYVMLELVLTRPDERRRLIRAADGLRFLVLDELHTYRGRQGASDAGPDGLSVLDLGEAVTAALGLRPTDYAVSPDARVGVHRVRQDVDYIMDTFPIVRRKGEKEYGEYRTKRLILEVYDAMAEAIRTGMPYRTIVDPPPGQGPRHPESTRPAWATPIAVSEEAQRP